MNKPNLNHFNFNTLYIIQKENLYWIYFLITFNQALQQYISIFLSMHRVDYTFIYTDCVHPNKSKWMQSNVGCSWWVLLAEYPFFYVIVYNVGVDFIKWIRITKPSHQPDRQSESELEMSHKAHTNPSFKVCSMYRAINS